MEGVICEHIWHKYGERMLLRDIILPLQPGSILCLLGGEGEGKTTLLRILTGEIAPSGGTVHANGILLAREDLLHARLMAEENLLRALRVRGADKILTQDRYARLAELFSLESCSHVLCKHLSHSQKERLTIACAVARRPQLLLLDAPICMDALREPLRLLAAESGMTVLFTARDPALALRCADTIALLSDGRIAQCDTPENVCAKPATLLCAQFLFPCNTLRGTVTGVRKHGEKCVLDVDGLEMECLCDTAPEVDDLLTLCIRCDRVHIARSPLPFGQNVSAAVTSVSFALGTEWITALLQNGQSVSACRHAEKISKLESGDKVFLCWDPHAAWLYPDAPVI